MAVVGVLAILLALVAPAPAAERVTISLDGEWDIADSKAADAIPSAYGHRAPVPGLAHSAVPAFPGVDEFEKKGGLVSNAGVSHQDRDWFWYRRGFTLPTLRSVAILRIAKAQFGAAVWLNGKKIGEHLPCFTAAVFDVSGALRQGANELVVRVGAHPGVLPPIVLAGTDFEKNRWTPGIYDSVSVLLSDDPAIETVQVAPKIAGGSIAVATRVRNHGSRRVSFALAQSVHEWKSTKTVATAAPLQMTLAPGESRTVMQTVRIPNAKLWWPEEPNLYVLETSTGGDTAGTRFGMREFGFETVTRRAYLNGRVYFLRGSNITLHRFFEDPLSGTLPWNEAWVRKLLVEIPHQMHWNSFRFCIGPVPEKWLDIADEAGLLIENEYFVWTGSKPEKRVHFDASEMIQEYAEWMRDNWNHPSVAIWDANNETLDPMFGQQIIPAVRKLDLSNRPWENSYNPPAGPDDPVEDHPYEFSADGELFKMTALERPFGKAPLARSAHAAILNEYGYLFLNRDGSPTKLTNKLYPRLLGAQPTAQDRLALNAYLLAGITEYWRAYRWYAGVLHFVYLASSDPRGYTSDHFRDVGKLELDPQFRDYMSNAFAPLGVYLNFWQPALKAGASREFTVMMVNDDPWPAEGTLSLLLEGADGRQAASSSVHFSVGALGQETYTLALPVPQANGDFLLKAVAERQSKQGTPERVMSRRRVTISF
jgi:hypothetical protein